MDESICAPDGCNSRESLLYRKSAAESERTIGIEIGTNEPSKNNQVCVSNASDESQGDKNAIQPMQMLRRLAADQEMEETKRKASRRHLQFKFHSDGEAQGDGSVNMGPDERFGGPVVEGSEPCTPLQRARELARGQFTPAKRAKESFCTLFQRLERHVLGDKYTKSKTLQEWKLLDDVGQIAYFNQFEIKFHSEKNLIGGISKPFCSHDGCEVCAVADCLCCSQTLFFYYLGLSNVGGRNVGGGAHTVSRCHEHCEDDDARDYCPCADCELLGVMDTKDDDEAWKIWTRDDVCAHEGCLQLHLTSCTQASCWQPLCAHHCGVFSLALGSPCACHRRRMVVVDESESKTSKEVERLNEKATIVGAKPHKEDC